MKCKDFLLYLPVGENNEKAIGGQVTAAKGIVRYIQEKSYSYDVVDSAQATGLSWFLRRVIIISNIAKLFLYSCRGRYKSSLFFYSAVTGLVLRFVPALILRFRGVNTVIFFRNSGLVHASKIVSILVRLLLSPYNMVFVQGTNLKKILISKGVDRARVYIIPNWVVLSSDMEVAREKDNQPPLLKLIFTGSLVRSKGVFELLEAVNMFDKNERLALTFVGDGRDREACVAYCMLHNLKNVFFVSPVPQDEIYAMLARNDVLVLPSYNEGFPNSVLEAMIFGLPVIVTGVGEVTDTVVDNYNGLIVKPGSARAIYDAIEVYLNNPDLICKHSGAAVSTAKERHSWERNCQYLAKLMLTTNKR